MGIPEYVVSKLIAHKAFKYYPDDIFLIKKVLSFVSCEEPRVLDVGCGNGHYSFLFEKCGASVIGFDYNDLLIEVNRQKADQNNSSISFLVADGTHPEKYLSGKMFDIIFMSGFSLFATNIPRQLMRKYIKLLSPNGILVFIQNSNQKGNIRKTGIRNYDINYLINEFMQLNCKIEKAFFYDRHISGRILHFKVFSDISTSIHSALTRFTGLPCNIVLIVSKEDG